MVDCGPASYEVQGGLWPEVMLVPTDEQRALVVGALYVIGNKGYIARQNRELKRAIKKKGLEPRWYGDTGPMDDDDDGDMDQEAAMQQRLERKAEETCQRRTATGAMSFGERVEALDKHILMDENEWVSKYEVIVSALRAGLYSMVPRQAWSHFESRVDAVVSAAEELAGKVIEGHVQDLVSERGQYGDRFQHFLDKEKETIRERYQPLDLTEAVVNRVAYWRWRRQAGA